MRECCIVPASQKGMGIIMFEENLADLERVLKALPSCIYLKDTEGKYLFATHYWEHIGKHDPGWSIRGKTDLEIRENKENARLAMEQDRKILETGEGATYTIQEYDDHELQYLELIKNPVFDDEGNIVGIVGLIDNVTEQELMRKKLEEYSLEDEMTKMKNRRAFDTWIDEELPHANFPLSIAIADCDCLKFFNDTFGHSEGDELIKTAALLLKLSMPSSAVCFRIGGDEFAVILPNHTKDDAQQVIERLYEMARTLNVAGQPLSISIGVATMQSTADDAQQAIEAADRAMYEYKQKHHAYLKSIYER